MPTGVRILFLALAGAAGTVALAWLTWWWADQPQSKFPSWLEAWATLLGVCAAIVAGFYAARAYALESQREHRWEEQQQASQAALIGAWPGDLHLNFKHSPEGDPYSLQVEDPETIRGAQAWLRNASPLPVTQVDVDFYLVLLDGNTSGRDRRLLGRERLSYLPPSPEHVPVTLDLSEDLHQRTPTEVEHSELQVEIRFRDAAGQVWSRDAVGQLVAER